MGMSPKAQPQSYATRYEIVRRDYVEGVITTAQFETAIAAMFSRRDENELCPYRLRSSQQDWAYRLPI